DGPVCMASVVVAAVFVGAGGYRRRLRPAEQFGKPARDPARFARLKAGLAPGQPELDALEDVLLGYPELPLQGARMFDKRFGKILAELVARQHVLARLGGPGPPARHEQRNERGRQLQLAGIGQGKPSLLRGTGRVYGGACQRYAARSGFRANYRESASGAGVGSQTLRRSAMLSLRQRIASTTTTDETMARITYFAFNGERHTVDVPVGT